MSKKKAPPRIKEIRRLAGTAGKPSAKKKATKNSAKKSTGKVVSIDKARKSKPVEKKKAAPCSRCGGKGKIERFGHVANGVCFKCDGKGIDTDAPDLTVAPPPEGGHPTREAWLEAAVDGLRPLFESVGAPLPQVRVSVGWARGSRKAIGQCWDAKATEDGVAQIFISPSLVDLVGTPIEDEDQEIKAGVLDVLLHECIHAAIGTKEKHGPVFRKTAHAVGLGGKMTATRPTGACCVRLSALAETLGPWPHGKITAQPKKQTTRMIKVVCSDPECECGGYTLRTTGKWIDVGMPTCPYGSKMKIA